MTYYEELGMDGDASADEIHQAYKRLVQLLHPDRLQDKASRHVAECQMRRLNEIHAVLSHPQRRREYDRWLVSPLPLPGRHLPAKRGIQWPRWPHRVWLGAGVVVMALLAFMLREFSAPPATTRNPIPPEHAIAASSRSPVSSPRREIPRVASATALERSQEQSTGLVAERSATHDGIAKLEGEVRDAGAVAPDLTSLTAPADSISTLPSPPLLQEIRDATPAAPSRRGLTGTWYLSGSTRSRQGEAYAAEFIEAVITEEAGVIQGRYHARYRVTDQTISPAVAFRFSGDASRAAASLLWVGESGAYGEVRLRMLSENTLEVVWVANRLGAMGLGSGTAVLLRREELP